MVTNNMIPAPFTRSGANEFLNSPCCIARAHRRGPTTLPNGI